MGANFSTVDQADLGCLTMELLRWKTQTSEAIAVLTSVIQKVHPLNRELVMGAGLTVTRPGDTCRTAIAATNDKEDIIFISCFSVFLFILYRI